VERFLFLCQNFDVVALFLIWIRSKGTSSLASLEIFHIWNSAYNLSHSNYLFALYWFYNVYRYFYSSFYCRLISFDRRLDKVIRRFFFLLFLFSIQNVSHRKSLSIFTPFKFSTRLPSWWTSYNETKHNLPDGANFATLGKTLEALGALVILLHTSRILTEFDDSDWILDSNNWNDNEKSFYNSYRRLQYSLATNTDFMYANRNYFYSKQGIFHSGLFYYLSECKNTITEEMWQ